MDRIARGRPAAGGPEELLLYNPARPLTGRYQDVLVRETATGAVFTAPARVAADGTTVLRIGGGRKTVRVPPGDPAFEVVGVVTGTLVDP